MQVVADLHLHSKYSRAVSPQMTLPVMARVAKQKGLDLLSASDFTHPLWFKEISLLLEEAGEGVYRLKSAKETEETKETQGRKDTAFILSTEISCIYKHNDKLRRIHSLIFVPSLDIAAQVTAALLKKGANLSADGRPIVGLSSRNLLELLLEVDERNFLIPCHVWTPHFGIYGSASGYDSLQEAFEDLTPYIYAIETGLSSDPDMNWSINELRNRSILSFSDDHSAPKMGREATVFVDKNGISNIKSPISNFELTYNDIWLAIMKDPAAGLKIGYTIEFYPEEGKYHFSGHRNCKVSYGPEEIKANGNICPVCHRRLTEGVLLRVQELSDEALSHRLAIKKNGTGLQWFTDTKHEQPSYVKLVPLLEIIAEGMKSTVSSQKVQAMFNTLCSELGSEIDVLLKTPIGEIEKIGGEQIAEGVEKIREGNIIIEPGYDGEYGKVAIWREGEEETKKETPQLSLDF